MAAYSKYAKKRDISEPIIKATLTAHGCTVWPLDTPVDLLVGFKGMNHLVEVKTPVKQGGMDKPTTLQLKFAENWNGEPYITLRSHEDAVEWIRKIKK